MNNIEDLISLSGIKQEVIARELNVSQATISFWKSGKKKPTVDNSISLAKMFGVSVGCIVGTEPIPEGYPDNYTMPVFYSDLKNKQQTAKEEGRIKKLPFSKAQIEYLDEREDRLVEKLVDALKEDLSSSIEKDRQAK